MCQKYVTIFYCHWLMTVNNKYKYLVSFPKFYVFWTLGVLLFLSLFMRGETFDRLFLKDK